MEIPVYAVLPEDDISHGKTQVWVLKKTNVENRILSSSNIHFGICR